MYFLKLRLIIICGVDDLIVFTETDKLIETAKDDFVNKFNVKDLGRPAQFLRVRLTWHNDETTSNNQKRLIKKLLEVHAITESKLVRSPIDTSVMSSNAHKERLSSEE